jgi:16S rRNA (adenine1518-N6/adenine1519-N6)-dimethyltransferase
LIQTGASIIGFEIDNAYIKYLENDFSQYKNFSLIKGDFLKETDEVFNKINKNINGRLIIVGNLPYYITTPILDKIFTGGINFDLLIFMMQKEVAERIISKEGNKTYGSLSIFCQLFSKPKIIARISPKSFYPQPKIESCLVLFEKNTNSPDIKDKDLFFKIVKSLFINRRKQLKNNLLMSPLLKFEASVIFTALANTGIPETIRGEDLDIKAIINLSNEIHRLTF